MQCCSDPDLSLHGRIYVCVMVGSASFCVAPPWTWGLDIHQQADEYIEKLRSTKAEDRDEAMRELKKLGPSAIASLARAERDSDPEVAGRAKNLIRIIAITKQLTTQLMRAIPSIEGIYKAYLPDAR